MKPVTQDIFGKPHGNCFAACVASILELPLHVVPNVMRFDDWFERVNWWLRRRGLFLIEMNWWDPYFVKRYYRDEFFIASGPAARGVDHCVIYRGTELAHEPHPDRTGLIGDPKTLSFLVVNDVSKLRIGGAA